MVDKLSSFASHRMHQHIGKLDAGAIQKIERA